jgi:hypothetical protein
MLSACLASLFGASLPAKEAGIFTRFLSGKRRKPTAEPLEPPTATFQEWVAAIVSEECPDARTAITRCE